MSWNKNRIWKLAIAAVLSLAMVQPVTALGANVVVNGSFETGYPGDYICGKWWYNVDWHSSLCDSARQGEWGQTIPGWRETGQGVNWYALGPYPEPVPPDGDRSIDLIGGGAGKIEQDVPTTPGTVYTLSFLYARNAACSIYGVSATVTAGVNSSVVTPTATGTTPGDWQVASFTFAGAAAPATTTTISFESNQGNASGLCGGVLIDMVSVDSEAAPPAYSPPVINPPTLDNAKVGDGYSYIFTAQGSPLITWSVSAGSLPAGLTLSPSGVLSGVPTATGTYTFTIRASNDETKPADTEVVTLIVLPATAPPVITTSGNLGSVQVGVSYTYTFSATGTQPFIWSADAASLPAGLSLSPAGVLSGVPTTPGTTTFTVRVSNPSATAATAQVTLTVLPLPPVINAISLGEVRVGVPYTYTFTAQGWQPITWSLATGTLPTGLTLSNGTLSGTPTAAGSFTFSVRASNGATTSPTASVSVNVLPAYVPPVITTSGNLGSVQAGVSYTLSFSATGSAPFTWSVGAGSLPAGLSLSPAGVLSGVPTTPGTSTFTIHVSNPSATAATAQVTLTVLPIPPVINAISLGEVRVGVPFTYAFTAQGSQPITWSLATGTLPTGLTLSNGTLSGTPTAAGTFNFSIRATNAATTSPTASVSVNVLPAYVPPVIDGFSVMGEARVGVAYSYTFTAQGTPPITWSVTAGALPAGLTLSPVGVLSGTPTTAGLATFTVRAANQTQSVTAVVSLDVLPAAPPASMPKTKEDCKKDGWRIYGVFRNQGDCVSYVESLLHAKPKTKDECKNGGWRDFDGFRNQGECVSYVQSLPKSRDDCRNDRWRGHGCYRDQGDCERDADRNGRDRERGRDDDRDDDRDRDRDRDRRG